MRKEELYIYKILNNTVDYSYILTNFNSFIDKTKTYLPYSKYLGNEKRSNNNQFENNWNGTVETFNKVLIQTSEDLNDHIYSIYELNNNFRELEDSVALINEFFKDISSVSKINLISKRIFPNNFIEYLDILLIDEYYEHNQANDTWTPINELSYRKFFKEKIKDYSLNKYFTLSNIQDTVLNKNLEKIRELEITRNEILKKTIAINKILDDVIINTNNEEFKYRYKLEISEYTEYYLNQHINYIYEKSGNIEICKFVLETILNILPDINDINKKYIERNPYRKFIFSDKLIKLVAENFVSYIGGNNIKNTPFHNINIDQQKQFYSAYIDNIFKIIESGTNYSNLKSINVSSTYRNSRIQ